MRVGEANPFAPYRVLREIARGGMGVVYEVVHDATGGRYALKTLQEGVSPEDLLRFRREVEALGALDHPNVVKIHAARLDAVPPFLVQDLLCGGSLAERLKAGPLPVEEAVAVVVKLARGVAAGHAQGILHRDLKPANVLFDEHGEPQLVDFGLARATEVEGDRLTVSGTIMGTPSYMAPEQVRDPRGAGAAADVYGLGAVLYAALTASPPFAGPLFVVLEAVLHRPPPPPSELNPRVPPAVEAECLRAMAKDASARHASAEALALDLEGCLSATARRPRARARLFLAALAAAAIAAAALVLTATRREAKLSPAELERRVSSLLAKTQRARAAGAYAECPQLRIEADVLTAQEEPSGTLRRATRQLALLEGLGHVTRDERDLARELALALGESREGRLLRRAIVGTAPDSEPAAAVAELVKAARGLGVPEAHLWLARARSRLGPSVKVAGQVVRDLEAYEASGGVLGERDLLLRIYACQATGQLETAQLTLGALPSASRELRAQVALALVRQRLEGAQRRFAEERVSLEWRARTSEQGFAPVSPQELTNFEAARRVYGPVADPLESSPTELLEDEREALALQVLRDADRDLPRARRATLAELEICAKRLKLVRSLTTRTRTAKQLDPFLWIYGYSWLTAEYFESTLELGELLWELGDEASRVKVGRQAAKLVLMQLTPEVCERLEAILRAARPGDPDRGWRQRIALAHAVVLATLSEPGKLEAEEIVSGLLDGERDGALDEALVPQFLGVRAQLMRDLGRATEGVADLDRLIALAPEETTLWVVRAELLVESGRAEEAVVEAERFIRSWTSMDSPFFRRAVRVLWTHARADRGQLLDEAISSILERWERRPAPWENAAGAGRSLPASGKRGKGMWQVRRGLLLLLLNRDAEVRAQLEPAIRSLNANSKQKKLGAQLVKAFARLQAGERAEAVEEFESVVEELDKIPGSWN